MSKSITLFSVECLGSDGVWTSTLTYDGEPFMYHDFMDAKHEFNDCVFDGCPGAKFRIVAHEFDGVSSRVVINGEAREQKCCLVCKGTYAEYVGANDGCPYCGNNDPDKTQTIARLSSRRE